MKIAIFLMGLFLLGLGSSTQSTAYLRDTSASLTLDNVKESSFLVSTKNNLGTVNGVYWFKINSIDSDRAILEMRTSHVLDLALFDTDGQILGAMGDTRFPSYFLSKQRLSFPLYLRASFPLEAYFPITISDERTFARNDKRSLLVIGFFYGTGIALITATIIFFLIARDTKFLFFALTTLAILLSLITRDNIFYLFNIAPAISMDLELIGHYIVGLTSTGFMLFYLQIRPHQRWLKNTMLLLSALSTLFLGIYIITKSIWFFLLVDITSILTVVFIWILILMIAKGSRKIVLIIVYSANIFFLTDFFVLHLFSLSILEISPLIMAVVAAINFTIIAAILLQSFKRMQVKGIIMNHKIKRYILELKELSTYKNLQDAKDAYMESLIYQFKLENIEVNVLSEISDGHSTLYIAQKYDLTTQRVEAITASLFEKLGINDTDDLSNLAAT